MNDLLQELAPISERAWEEIRKEATRSLKLALAARQVVDFSGPLGWTAAAVSTGRVEPLKPSPVEGRAVTHLRLAHPLMEVRVGFELSRAELDAIGRGSHDADLGPVVEAARTAALAEDRCVFHGHEPARIQGIGGPGAGRSLSIGDDYDSYVGLVAEATHQLRQAGVAGPYAIVLGPRCYTGLTKTIGSRGFPVIEQVRKLLDGPVVWAPAVEGAVVLSLRGGDFELIVGQDFSIGYLDHSTTSVQLYIQESFTFRVSTPEAAVPMTYTGGRQRRKR